MSQIDFDTVQLAMTPTTVVRRALAILAGAVLIALSAQVAMPLPGTPVPVTLQVLAVLVAGGLLGPRLGAASVTVYLLFGIAGAPVFAPGGPVGVARLVGPTGGYLLALPLAAAVVGRVAADGRSWPRLLAGLAAGVLTVHLGGVAQLAVLSGDLTVALRLGSLPFLLGDLLKIVIAALLLRRFGPTIHARL